MLFARVDPETFARAHCLAKDARQSYTQWLCTMIAQQHDARERAASSLSALHSGESARKRGAR